MDPLDHKVSRYLTVPLVWSLGTTIVLSNSLIEPSGPIFSPDSEVQGCLEKLIKRPIEFSKS